MKEKKQFLFLYIFAFFILQNRKMQLKHTQKYLNSKEAINNETSQKLLSEIFFFTGVFLLKEVPQSD